MYWWQRFDPLEVEAEFAQIRELGLAVVRIFMRWEDFQPGPFEMSEAALRRLGQVLDIAGRVGLLVQPTFFVGHMSGYNWVPAWALATEDDPTWNQQFPLVSAGERTHKRVRSVYQDPFMLRAMTYNIRQVVPRFRSHPALYGWDLGNEPDVFQRPPSREAAWLWNTLLVGEMKRLDPAHAAMCGIHIWSLTEGTIRPDDLAETNDLAIMHAYSLYCDAAKTPLDSDVVPFCGALTAHLSGQPTLFQEFGVCTTLPGTPGKSEHIVLPHATWDQYVASEEEAATYFAEVLEKLWLTGSVGAWAWCYGDYAPPLWEEPPCDLLLHERSFGLVSHAGTPKPHARVMQAFAAEKRPINPNPVVMDFGGITPDQYFKDPDANFRRLFQDFAVPASR
jgi:endo-1,4-beta-mannosidase